MTRPTAEISTLDRRRAPLSTVLSHSPRFNCSVQRSHVWHQVAATENPARDWRPAGPERGGMTVSCTERVTSGLVAWLPSHVTVVRMAFNGIRAVADVFGLNRELGRLPGAFALVVIARP